MNSLEEDSFVILGTSPPASMEPSLHSMPRMQNGYYERDGQGHGEPHESISSATTITNGNDLCSLSSINETELTSLREKFPKLCDASAPRAERDKFMSLTKEYCMMKENLRRSNVAMKEHFSLMNVYQTDIKKTREEDLLKIKMLTMDNDRLHQDTTRMEQELNDLRQRAVAEKNESDKYIKVLFADKVQLQNDLHKAHEALEVVQAAEVAKDAEIKELIQRNSESNAVVNNLRVRLEEQEKQLATFEIVNHEEVPDPKVKLLEEEKRGLNATIHNLRSVLADQQRTINDLEATLIAGKANMISLEDHRKILDEVMNGAGKVANETLQLQQRQSDISKAKDEQIKELNSQVNELLKNMEVQQVQCDVYKQDFELERSAREEINTEKQNVIEELKALQIQYDRLLQRVPIPVSSAVPSPSRTRNSGSSANVTVANQRASGAVFICPICSNSYRDQRTLENHVQDCLDGRCVSSMEFVH